MYGTGDSGGDFWDSDAGRISDDWSSDVSRVVGAVVYILAYAT